MDFLLLRRLSETNTEEEAQTLRKLWPLLPTFTVLEYKSPGRGYRRGNLDQLWAYLHLFIADGKNEVAHHGDLCGVLAVPRRTPSLDQDIATMGLTWENLGDGYFRVHGGLFVLYVLELEVVGLAENDELLYMFGSGEVRTVEAARFLTEMIGTKEANMNLRDMEGYDDVQRQILEIVDMMPADIVLDHYRPEQRLAGLDRDHQALALPLDVLRLLPAEYFRSLSPEIQAELQRRLAQP